MQSIAAATARTGKGLLVSQGHVLATHTHERFHTLRNRASHGQRGRELWNSHQACEGPHHAQEALQKITALNLHGYQSGFDLYRATVKRDQWRQGEVLLYHF